ncbi:Rpn family recombination-promoting nuclease/putative transposase [Pectobacterium cacticida]|uniref:Rpn family recombination-promoting nuclease/putative transposase n=1 Tax=Pectobacterium cacticida TaxID=69221 RepID=UPI0039889CBE
MQPHDAFFRQFLGDLDIARDFLTLHLPQAIQQHCDFTTLQRESASFVDEALRARISDMLYSLRTTQGKGYIYCVIEHQSRPERLMAFRLLRYSLAAMQQHLSQGHKTLPLVVPLLFYQGARRPYPYSLNWLDGFSQPALARQIYTMPFPLVDLTVIPDAEIKTHRRVALLELVQKHIRTRDMLELARDIGGLIAREKLPLTQQQALMFYIARAGRTSDHLAFFKAVAEQLSAEQEEQMETIAKQLERAGFEKGLRQGKDKWLAEGLEQGQKAAAVRIASQLLHNGMTEQQVQHLTGLTDAEMHTLVNKL